MAKILFRETECTLNPGESVLEGLLRHGVEVPNSCRGGACQSCLVQATSGEVPAAAQNGLKDTWKQRGYFMPCVCRPKEDAVIEVQPLGDAETVAAEIVAIERVSPRVVRVRLRTETPLEYEPGQFITLIRESDDLRRSYSLASVPADDTLEFHVQRWPGGQMSSWLHDEVELGQRVRVRGPHGECFYTPGEPERPLLMVGTGTGVAPLWGILRQALSKGHTGPIKILHRAHSTADLYLHEELTELMRTHANVTYIPCVRGGGDDLRDGSIDEIAQAELKALGTPSKVRAYLSGNPKIVRTIRRVFFLAGMSVRDIHMDAFVSAPADTNSRLAQPEARVASSAA